MPPVLFPASSAPGKDAVEGSGRLINAYSEALQPGAPAQYVIRRAPGLTLYSDAASTTAPRGVWFDATSYVYAAYPGSLSYFNESGTETVVGVLPDGAVSFTGRQSSTTDTNSYTLTSVPFGDAVASRRIVVGVAAMEYEGSELTTNGAFTSNLTGWTIAPSGSSWTWGGGAAVSAITGLGVEILKTLSQVITTVAGATYRVRFVVSALTGGLNVNFGSGSLSVNATGTFDFVGVASGTSTTVYISKTSADIQSGTVADISIKRVQLALPTAVTIGGVGATAAASATRAALWVATVPTGTTGSIVLTYANTMNEAYVAVWRLGGVSSDTPTDTDTPTTTPGAASVTVSAGSIAIFMAQHDSAITWTASGVAQDDAASPATANRYTAFSGFSTAAGTASITSSSPIASIAAAVWQGTVSALGDGVVTFAKNNKATPDQVLVVSGNALVTFTTASISAPVSVNSEVPTSVCFGESYFFVGTTTGYCYASGTNAATFSSLDRVRMEARPGPIIRTVFCNGELYVFLESNIEVWASNGNPNATGFPLNRTTVIWRGLIAPLAVCGFEEGFEGGLIWVADDNSVRVLSGYNPQIISTPDVERAIEACTNKSAIRCFVYDLDGHACVVVDVAGEATWVYDLSEGGKWHERKSSGLDAWRMTGNSVKAFGKWIAGDRTSGNLYQIDTSAYDEAGTAMSFVAESIAMEAFPQRLQIPRADFNFGMGVGTDAVPEPQVSVQWSDDGGHRWSDPVSRSLGENGRRKMQVRVNRMGLTGVKGRRFRLTIDDPVYVALLAGSMEVEARKS